MRKHCIYEFPRDALLRNSFSLRRDCLLAAHASGAKLQDLYLEMLFHHQLHNSGPNLVQRLRSAAKAIPRVSRHNNPILPDTILLEYDQDSVEVTRLVPPDSHPEKMFLNLENALKALKGNPKDNIALQGFDEVVIRGVPDWTEETERYVTSKARFAFPTPPPFATASGRARSSTGPVVTPKGAYLKAAQFARKLTQAIQQKRMDEVIAKSEHKLIQKQQDSPSSAASKDELEATKSAIHGMQSSLAKLKLAKEEGWQMRPSRLQRDQQARKGELPFLRQVHVDETRSPRIHRGTPTSREGGLDVGRISPPFSGRRRCRLA